MTNFYSLNEYDFFKLAKQAQDRRLYQRLMILGHFKSGMKKSAISRSLNIGPNMPAQWIKRFYNGGLPALQDISRSGRPKMLSDIKIEELKKYILDSHLRLEGGRLRGEDIVAHIHNTYGITYSLSGVYNLLHDMDFAWISSRSLHPKQIEEHQEQYKKLYRTSETSTP